MLSPEGLNMMARPNTVYVEGAAAWGEGRT